MKETDRWHIVDRTIQDVATAVAGLLVVAIALLAGAVARYEVGHQLADQAFRLFVSSSNIPARPGPPFR
jgi:hypothetical protein